MQGLGVGVPRRRERARVARLRVPVAAGEPLWTEGVSEQGAHTPP